MKICNAYDIMQSDCRYDMFRRRVVLHMHLREVSNFSRYGKK